MLRALTPDPVTYFGSDPDSGYSIDNLAPGVPEGFGGEGLGTEILVYWDPSPEEDFQYYRVYRGDTHDFDISEALAVYATADTSRIIDDVDECTLYYYRVTATDFAGNESEPSPAIGLCAAASVDTPEAVHRFGVLAAHPNPFASSTRIVFSLATRERAVLGIHDITGRLVAKIYDAETGRGKHSATWDGCDTAGREVSPGVYFARLEAGGKRATHKITLAR
jgi:hypothetical protein